MADNSDINTVLSNSLSPDAATRTAAEAQLNLGAQNNFPLYLATLVQELANEASSPTVRVAAGLALKNALTARDTLRLRELQAKWLQQTDPDTKARVKALTLQALGSGSGQPGQTAAQVIAAIAAIELPRAQWTELLPILVQNVSTGGPHQKQASLTCIGYICESPDADLRNALISHSNAILTAVVQGARKDEENNEVRFAAISALGDSLEFVGNNFKHEGERNYIMQVVCEATQAEDSRIRQGAFGCLNRIMDLYYENMRFYMEKALFGLTILGMKNEDEDVAKLAVEFWSTVCEEETQIEAENSQIESPEHARPFYNFARVATNEVVPTLLQLLTQQDEDADDNEYNLAKAAYQSLQLYAQAVGHLIIQHVIAFVETNLRSDDWHAREAAVSAFGAIMEGPEEQVLEPIVKQALPVLIHMMDDSHTLVKDSTAYALGRITELCPGAIDASTQLDPLVNSLLAGIQDARMASSCCWALMNLVEKFSGEMGFDSNAFSAHFTQSVANLLQVTGRADVETTVRTTAYEALSAFVTHAAPDSLQAIGALTQVIVTRLEETIPLQSQVVSVEDKMTLEEMQISLNAVLQAIILRLDNEISPLGNRIMEILLHILTSVSGRSTVPEAVFATISGLANAMQEDFIRYMDAFAPYILNALAAFDQNALCSIAIGLVSDIVRSLGERASPYCDSFMNHLLNILNENTHATNQLKPAILTTFGDIATAIGGYFEQYLPVVGQMLHQAANVTANPEDSLEVYHYVVSLREGLMDAWGGILGAMKLSNKTVALQAYVEWIFHALHVISQDLNRSEALMRSAMGVIGDLAEAFPGGELVEGFKQEWLIAIIRETRSNRDFKPRTIDTARWAREQVKCQIAAQEQSIHAMRDT